MESLPDRPAPYSRREALRALAAGALALPVAAGCGVLGPPRPPAPSGPAPVFESPRIGLEPDTLAAAPDSLATPDPLAADTAAGDGAATTAAPPEASAAEPRALVLPPRLREGATIGLVAPAGVLRSVGQLDDSVRAIRELGFEPRVGRHVLARHGFLAGTDRERADDLMAMFLDDDVDAILCVRGGWGCARLLPLLDYDAIRAHPKPLVGYSDVTALLLALYHRAGLVSFHGPVGISMWAGSTTRSFLDVLVHGRRIAIEGETRPRRTPGQTVRSGVAEGRLVGGNLSVIAGLAGTGFLPDFDGHVVFFEETGEESYRLDRLMTQLVLAGVLRRPAAVVFGQCDRCTDGGSAWSAEAVLRDHLAALNVPAWLGAPVGHVSPVHTLPVGVRVRTDADAGTLEMLEPAVV